MARAVVLGVDLASARWADSGAALLAFERGRWTEARTGVIDRPQAELTPATLATVIDDCARRHRVAAVGLDGPQAWRDPDTDAALPGVGRRAEYACRAQSKTGVEGVVYPRTQQRWVRFCIELFDRLLERPGVRLADEWDGATAPGAYRVLECFPTSTWRSAGLEPLPGKNKKPRIAAYYERLARAFGLPGGVRMRSHDDLQALVAALPAAAIAGGPCRAIPRGAPVKRCVGASGHAVRVEGFIWDATPG